MRIAAVFVLATALGVSAQPRTARAPRLPDLEGIWNFSTLTPIERPPNLAGRETLSESEAQAFVRDLIQRTNRDRRDGGAEVDVARAVNDGWFDRGTMLARVNGRYRTSLVVDPPDGHVPPLLDSVREKIAALNRYGREHQADGPENRSLQERCLSFNAGPPILPGPYNNYLQILQFPGYVVLFTEMIHDARIVPLGDSAPARLPLLRWLGEPRGRYENGALVIDSRNFVAEPGRDWEAKVHLTEWLTRVDSDTLLYRFTVDNPAAYTRPWTVELPMVRSDDQIFEYACHEGNRALEDILRGARAQERSAVSKDPSVQN
jgi:hypothetical protein